MPERKIEGLVVPEGWSIESITRHRTIGDWALTVLFFLLALIPSYSAPVFPPAELTYILRRDADGVRQRIRLPGDHAPDALVEALRLLSP